MGPACAHRTSARASSAILRPVPPPISAASPERARAGRSIDVISRKGSRSTTNRERSRSISSTPIRSSCTGWLFPRRPSCRQGRRFVRDRTSRFSAPARTGLPRPREARRCDSCGTRTFASGRRMRARTATSTRSASTPTTNVNASARAVETGSADLVPLAFRGQSAEQQRGLFTRVAGRLHLDAQPVTFWWFFNTRVTPFDDVRVRRAVNFAVDRARLNELAGGLDSVTCQVLPSDLPGYRPYCPYTVNPNEAGTWTAPDLAKARSLVAASGTRGTSVAVTTVPTPGSARYRSLLRLAPSATGVQGIATSCRASKVSTVRCGLTESGSVRKLRLVRGQAHPVEFPQPDPDVRGVHPEEPDERELVRVLQSRDRRQDQGGCAAADVRSRTGERALG